MFNPPSRCFVSAADYATHWTRKDQMPKRNIDVAIVEFPDHHNWPPEQMIDIFNSLLIHGFLDPDSMSPEQAERWATKLGRWGRIALTDREVKEQGWAVVRKVTGAEE